MNIIINEEGVFVKLPKKVGSIKEITAEECDKRNYMLLETFSSTFINLVERRLKRCEIELSENIDRVENHDNCGIMFRRKDGTLHMFSYYSYNSMLELKKLLENREYLKVLDKFEYVDQLLKSILEPGNNMCLSNSWKDCVSLLTEVHGFFMVQRGCQKISIK